MLDGHNLVICYKGNADISGPTPFYGIKMFSLIKSWSDSYVCYNFINTAFSSGQFSRSVVSDSLRPYESQHARPPCPSPTPRVHSDSRQWCHPAISFSVVPFSSSPIPPSIRVFSNESILHMRWPKYWSFSFSIIPSKEHPGLVLCTKKKKLSLCAKHWWQGPLPVHRLFPWPCQILHF